MVLHYVVSLCNAHGGTRIACSDIHCSMIIVIFCQDSLVNCVFVCSNACLHTASMNQQSPSTALILHERLGHHAGIGIPVYQSNNCIILVCMGGGGGRNARVHWTVLTTEVPRTEIHMRS